MTGKPLIPYDEVKGTRQARRETKDAMKQPVKKVNRERVAKKAESEGFDPDYLDWTRTQPDVVTGKRSNEAVSDAWCDSAILRRYVWVEAAHMRAGRTKGTDATALPVDHMYHKEQHRIGLASWAKKYSLDIPALIAAHRKRYALDMAEKVKARK